MRNDSTHCMPHVHLWMIQYEAGQVAALSLLIPEDFQSHHQMCSPTNLIHTTSNMTLGVRAHTDFFANQFSMNERRVQSGSLVN